MIAGIGSRLLVSGLLENIQWENTALGPKTEWSETLNTSINICLLTQFPTMVIWGEEMIQIYNEAYTSIIGSKHPEAFGSSMRVVWKEFWSEIGPILENTLHRGQSYFLENKPFVIRSSGVDVERFFTFSYSPILDSAKEAVGIFVTAVDTTDTVHKEQKLRDLSSKQLSMLFHEAPVALAVFRGKDFVVDIANERMLELWGRTSANVLGLPLFDCLPEARNQGYEAWLQKVYDSGERFIIEEASVALTRNGRPETIFVKFVFAPLIEEVGSISGVMLLADEITTHVNSRKAAKESELRLRMAIEATKMGTWEYRPLSGGLHWSDECRKIYAIPDNIAVDFESFSRHIYPDDAAFVQNEINKSLNVESDGNYDIVYRIVRYGDGVMRWIRAQGKVFFNHHNIAERFIGTVVDITEQKQIEETLRESEFKARLAIEVAGIGTFVWNIANNSFQHSARLTEMFGFKPGTILTHKDLEDRIHTDDRSMRATAHEKALTTGHLFYEARVVWPDGTVHWFKFNGTVYYEKGIASRMYGTALDITSEKSEAQHLENRIVERTRSLQVMNQELKRSEEKYHRVISEVQDYAIILLNTEGLIQTWNKGAERIKRYSEKEILGKHISIFYTAEDRASQLPQRLINEATISGRAGHEGWRVRKDGSHFWGSITITALHDDQGYVIGYSKVTRDLTERKLAEEELRQKHEALKISEQQYHLMVSEVQDYAIVLLDKDGVVQNWNKGAQNIKQYREDEIVGKHFRVFYLPEDQKVKLPEKLLLQATLHGKAIHEGWRQRKDGTHFWGSIVITALHNETDILIGFSKVTRDLTQKKSSEDQILVYMKRLELQNKELEQFAYVASHDLQEPLRKIQTFSDIIQNNTFSEQLVMKYLDKIKLSSVRMSQLVTSLLRYSRLAGHEGHQEDVDLDKILGQVRTDFELLISEKKAQITGDKLPMVKGHAMQLSQLFANLIGNALKFNVGTPIINVSSRVINQADMRHANLPFENYIEVTFRDNGIGFEPKFAEKIFTIFQRLHDRRTFEGTGIGLALCKKIMENHQGIISATSTLGEGATFYTYFPIHDEQP